MSLHPSSADNQARSSQPMRATSGANLFTSATRPSRRPDDNLVASHDAAADDEEPDGIFMYIPLAAPIDTVSQRQPAPVVKSSASVSGASRSVNTNVLPPSGEYVQVCGNAALDLNQRPADGGYVAVCLNSEPETPHNEHVPNVFGSAVAPATVVVEPPPAYEFAPPETMGTIPLYTPMAMVSEDSDALVLSDDDEGGAYDDGPAPPVGKSRSRPMLQRTRADKQLVFGTTRRAADVTRLIVTVMVPTLNLAKRVLCDPHTTCGAALEKMVSSFRTAGLVGSDFNACDHQLSRDPIALALLENDTTMGAALGITQGNAPSPLFVVQKPHRR